MTKRVWVEHLMGMPISIHVRSSDPDHELVDRAVAAAYAELVRVDQWYSTYREDSWVSRVRCGEIALGSCPPEVQDVAAQCAQAQEATGGAFTPWLPDPDGVVRFDPTGLVKGWAIDRAGQQLAGLPGAIAPPGSTLTIISNGKLYAEPECVRPRILGIPYPRSRR